MRNICSNYDKEVSFSRSKGRINFWHIIFNYNIFDENYLFDDYMFKLSKFYFKLGWDTKLCNKITFFHGGIWLKIINELQK